MLLWWDCKTKIKLLRKEVNYIGYIEHPNEYIEQKDCTILRIISNTYGTFDFSLDNEDVERVRKYHWGIFHVHKPKEWTQVYYASTGRKEVPTTNRLLHRFLMNAEKGRVIDHIDGTTFNMRKANLRNCTVEENSMNRIKPYINTSGVKGVRWADKLKTPKWHAYLKKDDKTYNLGYYDKFEDAVEARKQAEIKFQGEFSRDYGKDELSLNNFEGRSYRKQLDKTKITNIKCRSCKHWDKLNGELCEITHEKKRYNQSCKQFDWR